MFIKALIFFALIMIVVTLVKRGKKGGTNMPTTVNTPSSNKAMKRCAECGVHLPEQEALTYQTLSFCCNEHKKLYLKDKET